MRLLNTVDRHVPTGIPRRRAELAVRATPITQRGQECRCNWHQVIATLDVLSFHAFARNRPYASFQIKVMRVFHATRHFDVFGGP